MWPWNWFNSDDSAYEFSDKGWRYADTWQAGTFVRHITIEGPEGRTALVEHDIRYAEEYGITASDIKKVGYDCICKDGDYSPRFALLVETESLVLNSDRDEWADDGARNRITDPRVADYWIRSWQWYRRRLVRVHEARHREHAEKNYELLRDDLLTAEQRSYISRRHCLRAALSELLSAIPEFFSHELRDAGEVNSGREP